MSEGEQATDVEKTTSGAERMFRPLLDDIPFLLPPDPDKKLVFKGILNDYCPALDKIDIKFKIHIIKRKYNKDIEENRLGYGLPNHESDRKNCYSFNIYLNSQLFPGGYLDSPQLRKEVGAHELTHCIATVNRYLKTINDTERKKIRNMMHRELTLETKAAQIIKEIRETEGEQPFKYNRVGKRSFPQRINYDDGHFRPYNDTSAINFKKLNDQLLFSKVDFEKYIGERKLPALRDMVKTNLLEAYKDALQYAVTIAKEMNLYEDFVAKRIADILNLYNWEQ